MGRYLFQVQCVGRSVQYGKGKGSCGEIAPVTVRVVDGEPPRALSCLELPISGESDEHPALVLSAECVADGEHWELGRIVARKPCGTAAWEARAESGKVRLGAEPAPWSLRVRPDGGPPIVIDFEVQVVPLTLIEDLDVGEVRGVNTLGNFGVALQEGLVEGWAVSADRSVAVSRAKFTMALAECDVDVECGLGSIHRSSGERRTVDVELGVLPCGDHRFTIRAHHAGKAQSESVAVDVSSLVDIWASLPLARRFEKGVDLADGHLTHAFTDLSLKGPGLPLEFSRTYSNLAALSKGRAPLGAGWTHSYHSWAQKLSDDLYTVVAGDGTGRNHTVGAAGGAGSHGHHGALTAIAGGVMLTTPARLKYSYIKPAADGRLYLTRIEDANGRWVSLSYDARVRLETVRDASARRHLHFTYETMVIGGTSFDLLKTVEIIVGTAADLTVAFSYDDRGNLKEVQRGRRKQAYEYTPDAYSPHRLSAYVDPDGYRTQYVYRPPAQGPGTPVSKMDVERVWKVIDPENYTTRFEHELQPAGANVVPVRTTIFPAGPDAKPTTYHFDDNPVLADGAVVRVVEPQEKTTVLRWLHEQRLLRTETDGTGRVIEYTPDALGNVLEETMLLGGMPKFEAVKTADLKLDVDQVRATYTYTASGSVKRARRSQHTEAGWTDLLQILYFYDPNGNPTGQVQRPGNPPGEPPQTEWDVVNAYDPAVAGRLVGRKVREGEDVTYGEFNDLGQPGKIETRIDATRRLVTHTEYDVRGRAHKKRDEIGGVLQKVIEVYFDDLDLPHERREYVPVDGVPLDLLGPGARVTKFEYTPGGLLREEKEMAGETVILKTVHAHDKLGRVTTVEEHVSRPDGPIETITQERKFDAMGRVEWEKDRRGIKRVRHYDAQGRLDSAKLEWLENGQPQTSPDESLTYLGMTDLVETSTDHSGHVSRFAYDRLLHRRRRVLPIAAPNAEEVWHDPLGNPVVTSDANGHRTRNQFDAFGRLAVETNALEQVRRHQRYADGKLRTTVDEATGWSIAHVYDGLGRATETVETVPGVDVTQPAKTTITYDDAARLTTTVSPERRVTKEWRDARGLLVRRTVDPDGLAITHQWQYDARGSLIAELGPTGMLTRHHVDGLGRRRRTSIQLEANVTISESFDYDGQGNLTRHVDRTGDTRQYGYDARGRRTHTWVTPAGAPKPIWLGSTIHEDAQHRVVESDAKGGVATTTLDGLYRVRSREHSARPGERTAIGYKGIDIESVADTRGHAMRYLHDALHRVTLITDPLGHETKVEYLDPQRQRRTTDRRKIVTVVQLDGRGRAVEESREQKRQWRKTYDSEDRVTSVTDALGHVTHFELDQAGRMTRLRRPDHVARYAYDANGQRSHEWLVDDPDRPVDVQMEYDGLGRMRKRTDACGYVTWMSYDGKGRLIALQDPKNGFTTYRYDHNDKLVRTALGAGETAPAYLLKRDALGRLDSIQDPMGHVVSFDRDTRGLRTGRRVKSNAGQPDLLTTYGFDADGRPTTVAHPDGSFITWGYDKAGRVETLTAGGNNVQPVARSVTYGYDEEDNLTTITAQKVWGQESMTKHTSTFDRFGRLELETTIHGHRVRYGYDDKGRLRSRELEGTNQRTSFAYFDRDVLREIAGPLGTFTFEYDRADRLSAVHQPGKRTLRLERLANGWVNAVRHLGADGKPVLEYVYPDIDKVGNARLIEVIEDGKKQTRRLTYDDLHRLSGEQIDGQPPVTIVYDKAGRRSTVQRGEKSTQYDYDSYGRLEAVRAGARVTDRFAYTPTGKVARKWSSGTLVETYYNAHQQAAMAFWGKSAQIEGPIEPSTRRGMTLDHDHLGRRILRVGPGAGEVEFHVYAGLERIADFQGPGGATLARVYERGRGLLGVLARRPDGAMVPSLALRDRTGSVERWTGVTGGVTATRELSAFGEVLGTQGEPPAAIAFGGGFLEPMSAGGAVYHMGDRQYDASIGRFWSPDPVEPLDGPELAQDTYAYALNRPTAFVDPHGMWPGSFEEDDDLDLGSDGDVELGSDYDDELDAEMDDTFGSDDGGEPDYPDTDEPIVDELTELEESGYTNQAFTAVTAGRGETSDLSVARGGASRGPADTPVGLRAAYGTISADPEAAGDAGMWDDGFEVTEGRTTTENAVVRTDGSGEGSRAVPDWRMGRSVVSSTATVAENVIWTLGGAPRGKILERVAGVNIGGKFKDIDDLRNGVATQFKTTSQSSEKGLRGVTRKAARAATNYADEVAEAGGSVRAAAVVGFKSGTPMRSVEIVEKAVEGLDDVRATVRGVRGLPGVMGRGLTGLGHVAGIYSMTQLPENYRRTDVESGIGNSLSTGTTLLYGAGFVLASPALVTGSAILGAASLGYAGGNAIYYGGSAVVRRVRRMMDE